MRNIPSMTKGHSEFAECPKCHKFALLVRGKSTCLGCGYTVNTSVLEKFYSGEMLVKNISPEMAEVYKTNEELLKVLQDNLPKMTYKRAGFTEEIFREYDIGFYPKHETYQKDTGLLECMSKRLIFAVRDHLGNICGFCGRATTKRDEEFAKYINSPASDVFKKGEILYNFNRVLKRPGRKIVICEGYFDAIAFDRCGINAVAPMGTALTEAHVYMLKSVTNHVNLCFDNDEAGQRAFDRAKEMCEMAGLSVSKYTIPSGYKDPDEYVANGGKLV